MKTQHTIKLHVYSWGVFLISYMLLAKNDDDAAGLNAGGHVLHFIVLAGIFYGLYYAVIPWILARRYWVLLIPAAVGASMLFETVRLGLEWLLVPGDADTWSTQMPMLVVSMLILTAVLSLIRLFYERDRDYWSMRSERMLMELQFLRTQMNPHFLFNTLNLIYTTVEPHSESAAEAVDRLSQLMRYTLRESPDGYVSLQQEVSSMQDYLYLVSMRYDPDFHVEMEVPLFGTEDKRIPAMVLLPLIENASKYGVWSDPENPVKLKLYLDNNWVYFRMENLVAYDQEVVSMGIGNINIEKRLKLMYKGAYRLKTIRDAQKYITILRFKFKA